MAKCDVLIVGAGLSGLAAGVFLARNGKKVIIAEAHTVPGGLNSYYSHGGRTIDVGLHAMTDYALARERRAPLNRLLRRLGIRRGDLYLAQQVGSTISFPDAELSISNKPDILEASIHDRFPDQIQGFRQLNSFVSMYDASQIPQKKKLAHKVVRKFITDPLLAEMLMLPILCFGSTSEKDVDFHEFSARWKGIYQHGLSRPEGGMTAIINLLVDRFQEAGGELRLGHPVKKLHFHNGRIAEVEVTGNKAIKANRVISCAGYLETMALCGDVIADLSNEPPDDLSFVEFVGYLDNLPLNLDIFDSMVFFSSRKHTRFECPNKLVDFGSGAVCFPNNFVYHQTPNEGMVRISMRASYKHWSALKDRDEYRDAKVKTMARMLREVIKFVPDFRPQLTYYELLTPMTIKRYSRHINGAVNGLHKKRRDGCTPFGNLFVCGTDQGMNGIVGAMYSGLLMAQLHGF